MSSQLQNAIHSLAATFAQNILAAVREASFGELVSLHEAPATETRRAKVTTVAAAPTAAPQRAAAPAPARRGPKKGGRTRRSPEQLKGTIARIVAALKGKRDGLRSEDLQKQLGLTKQELFGPLTAALEEKSLVKTGNRRGTTYFAK